MFANVIHKEGKHAKREHDERELLAYRIFKGVDVMGIRSTKDYVKGAEFDMRKP